MSDLNNAENSANRFEEFATTAKDGVSLTGRIFYPAGQPKAFVQISAATAVDRSYYDAFAGFLTERGFVVGVGDYRGSGPRAPKSLAGLKYRFLDYGTQDIPAFFDEYDRRFPALPKLIVGHSVGGQMLGFLPKLQKVRGFLAVATSVGYFGYMPTGYRMLSYYFFYLFTNLSHRVVGYNAAKRFGYMENLPTTVVREWAYWCSKADYFFDPEIYGRTVPKGAFQEYSFPVKVYWVDDDPIANRRSVPRYWSHVKSTAPIDVVALHHRDFGVKHFGHFGFFRRKFRETLWSRFAADLENFVANTTA